MSKDGKSAEERAAEASINVALAQARQKRNQASIEYERATDGVHFTKEFHTHNAAIMRDPLETQGVRFMAWLRRYAWGEYSLFAIGIDGEPRTQTDACGELGFDKRRLTHIVNYYETRGYLYREGKRMYPVLSPQPAPPPEKVARSRDFLAFLENWKVAHSSDFHTLEVARSTVERIRKVMLSDYKKSRAQATNGETTLLRSQDMGQDPLSAGLPTTSTEPTPLETSNAAHTAKTAEKLPDKAGMQPRAQAAEFLYSEIARMQAAYPHSQFASLPIDRSNPDHQKLITILLNKLGSYESDYLVGYIVWIMSIFKGLNKRSPKARPPGREGGADGLGWLVKIAEDYARVAGGQERGSAAEGAGA